MKSRTAVSGLLSWIIHSSYVQKNEYYDYLIRIARQPKRYVLTDVMLETLSIIAYRQPVTKLEIEKIRGVKSDHAVNKLVEYGLVEEVGRMDAPGQTYFIWDNRGISSAFQCSVS